MAAVLNRSTLEFFESVNTPDFDPAVWIINPDLSQVEGHPIYYWVINPDDSVSLMDTDACAARVKTLPYDGLDLAGAIALKSSGVNDYRDSVINGGWIYNGVKYDSTPDSRQNMAGTMTLIASGFVVPPTFSWRTLANTNTPFDNTGFAHFYQSSCIWVETIYETSWYHKGVIANLTTVADVIAYDYTVGWIPGFTIPA